MINFARPIWCALALSAVLLGLMPGCAASTLTPTQGWALTLRLAEPRTTKQVYYDLNRDGELTLVAGLNATYAGDDRGVTAAVATPTWRGMLTAEELAPLVEHLESGRDAQTVEPESNGPTYRIALRPATGNSRTLVTGPTPFATRLFKLLQDLVWSHRRDELDQFGATPK